MLRELRVSRACVALFENWVRRGKIDSWSCIYISGAVGSSADRPAQCAMRWSPWCR